MAQPEIDLVQHLAKAGIHLPQPQGVPQPQVESAGIPPAPSGPPAAGGAAVGNPSSPQLNIPQSLGQPQFGDSPPIAGSIPSVEEMQRMFGNPEGRAQETSAPEKKEPLWRRLRNEFEDISFGLKPEDRELGQFEQGLLSGIHQLGTDAAAVGATAVTAFKGPEAAQELMDLVKSRQDYSHKTYPKTIQKVEDIESISDFAIFTARALGEQIPVVASIVLGGGVGGLVGKLVEKGAVKGSVAGALAARVGAPVGAFGTAAGIETGATAGEQIEAIGEIKPGVATAAGLAKGSLEMIVPLAIGSRLGLTPGLAKDFTKVIGNRLKAAVAGGLTEAVTETLQESIDVGARKFVDDNYDVLSDEVKSRILNAAATGGLVGLIFGGVLGGGRYRAPQEAGQGQIEFDPQVDVAPGENPFDKGPWRPPNAPPTPPIDPELMSLLGRPENIPVGGDLKALPVYEDARGTVKTLPGNLPLDPRGLAVTLPEQGPNSQFEQDGLNPYADGNIIAQTYEKQVKETGIDATGTRLFPSRVDTPVKTKPTLEEKERTNTPNRILRDPSTSTDDATQIRNPANVIIAGKITTFQNERNTAYLPALFLNSVEDAPVGNVKEHVKAQPGAEMLGFFKVNNPFDYIKNEQEAYRYYNNHPLQQLYKRKTKNIPGPVSAFVDNDPIDDQDTIKLLRTRFEFTDSDVRAVQVLTQTFNEVWKELNIPYEGVINFHRKSDNPTAPLGEAAWDSGSQIAHINIRLDLQDSTDLANTFSTLVHEIGHQLVYIFWEGAPAEIKYLLDRKYVQDSRQAEQDLNFFLTQFVSAYRARELTEAAKRNNWSAEQLHDLILQNQAYWLNKHEWFAEQFVRAQSYKGTRLDAVKKYLSLVVEKFRAFIYRAWKAFKEIGGEGISDIPNSHGKYTGDLNAFMATPEYEVFLQYIKSNKRQYANFDDAVFNNRQQYSDEGQRVREVMSGPAEEARAKGRQIEDVLDQLDPTKNPQNFTVQEPQTLDDVVDLLQSMFDNRMSEKKGIRKDIVTNFALKPGFAKFRNPGFSEVANTWIESRNGELFQSDWLHGLKEDGTTDTVNSRERVHVRIAKIWREEMTRQGNLPDVRTLDSKLQRIYWNITDSNSRVEFRRAYGLKGNLQTFLNNRRVYNLKNKEMYLFIKYVNAMMKQFKLPHNVVLDMRSSKVEAHVQISRNNIIIELPVGFDNANDITHTYMTLIHEFSHVLVKSYLHHAPAQHQEALMHVYNAERLKAEQSYDYYIANFVGPSRAAQMEEMRATLGLETEAMMKKFLTNQKDYWLGFDEWSAEQLVKSMFLEYNIALLGSNKYFYKLKGLGRKMVYEAYKNIPKDQRAKLGIFIENPNSGNFVLNFKKLKASPEFAEFVKGLRKLENRDDYKSAETLRESVEIASKLSSYEQRQKLEKLGLINATEPSNPSTAFTNQSNEFFTNYSRTIDPSTSQEDIDKLIVPANRMNYFMNIALNIVQISKENPTLQQLHKYVEQVDTWYTRQTEWMSMADATLKEWKKLNQSQMKGLNDLLFEIEGGKYYAGEVDPRAPTEQELAAMAARHGLERETLLLYQRITDDFKATLDFMYEAEMRNIDNLVHNPGKRVEQHRKLIEKYEDLLKKPYFPLSRFGDFAIIVKDSEGITVYLEHFDSKRQAKKAVTRIQRATKHWPNNRLYIRKVPDSVNMFQGLPVSILETVRERLQGLSDEQLDWLDDYITHLSPSVGASKLFAQKNRIPGHSSDAMRTYAMYFFANSKYFARIQYGPEMENQINDLDLLIQDSPHGTDATKMDMIRSYMIDHFKYIMNPKDDWAALRAFFFHWHLGFNIKSAALNFTQIPMTAWPYISHHYGSIEAITALTAANKNLRALYKKGNLDNIDPALLKAITMAEQDGIIDESQATDLAAIAQGSRISSIIPADKWRQTVLGISHYSAYLFSAVEKYNRRIVFRAMWELALKRQSTGQPGTIDTSSQPLLFNRLTSATGDAQFTKEQAIAYIEAKEAVRSTQFLYASWSRPKFMWGKKGNIFMFFNFLQQITYFGTRDKAAKRFWLMALIIGGLMGLPGVEDLSNLIKVVSRKWFGKDFDPQKEVRKLVVDFFDGSVAPDLILHGTSRYGLGMTGVADMMGLPVPNIDLSASVSLGSIVPGMGALGDSTGRGFDATLGSAFTEVAGAAFGPAIGVMNAISDTTTPLTDHRRWSKLLPRALGNVNKAFMYGAGGAKTRTGASIAEFDTGDPKHVAELALIGLGFASTRMSQRWDRESMQREAEKFWIGQRGILMDEFDRAIRDKDKEARKEAVSAIKEFNKDVPYKTLAITNKSLKSSVRQRHIARHRFEAGLGSSNATYPISKDVNKLFPEVEDSPTK